ncbi:uncharacterized protein EV154DRAFT_491495 [Mucor mucedo]|uniref:uncharacterized protein n=1 Tax=Mucor mucedo TaxID=29922 RepID=UPI0022208B86|nr:uncharacterized protein EV154DRAFT_491495 [Mucor mucedo]KAI7896576.1 hypothetical protein EV154DRAFT_491495 [Mucor mucedo]
MDTSYTYPQLFDMDTTFDTDLFGGLNLSDNYLDTNNNNNNNNNRKGDYNVNNNHSYLQYLQNNNHNEFYYDACSQQMLLSSTVNMDLPDYDFNPHTDHKLQQYNWLYDPIDTFLPPQQQANIFHENNPSSSASSSLHMVNGFDTLMSENMDAMTTVQGGMSRDYVSLSDVNSFVAKADSKHSCLQVPMDCNGRTDFSSSESTTNEDSEDDYSDSENELRWPSFHAHHNHHQQQQQQNDKQKLLIKIKKPITTSVSSTSAPGTATAYNNHEWLLNNKKVYRNKYRKSMSNIFQDKKNATNKRRGSAPNAHHHPHYLQPSHVHHRLTGSLHSSSSLTSLSNTLQRSMRVSDSMNFLSRGGSSDEDEDEEGVVEEEDDDDEEEEEEEEDDDEYQIRHTHAPPYQLPTKKGRNVDKACNHCKRSHLRCDDMRPCRRCVATGKTGCKDVQHKPRGRPKLHKK